MKTAVIGLGLIGGSMAKAFKDNTDSEVYGLDINESIMLKAKLVGAIEGELTDDILAQCDRVIIALYPESTVEFLQSKADIIKKGAVVIDCSGVKRYVFTPAHELAKAHGFEFIGGHPMAGVERWGFDSSFGMLFNNASMIFTPTRGPLDRLRQHHRCFSRTARQNYRLHFSARARRCKRIYQEPDRTRAHGHERGQL